ncbi:unnamed protein product, partial [marine sediment metagenome]
AYATLPEPSRKLVADKGRGQEQEEPTLRPVKVFYPTK